MKSAFGGGAYTLRSLPLAAQTAINVFAEPSEQTPGEFAFYSRAGRRRLATLSTSGCRGIYAAGGYLWAVYGSTVYRMGTDWVPTTIGTLTSTSGAVEFAHNTTDLIVAHSGGWHKVSLAGTTLTFVPDSEGTSDVSFVDNYLVQCKLDGTYQWSDVGATDIDVLSFASAEGHPDRILRTLSDHRELWLFGESTVEVAVVTTDPDLPFTRTSFIEQGILAPRSAAKEDNSVFWLGKNEKGQGVVYRAQGYTPQRISTFAIEEAIAKYASPETARAYTYQQGGHHFYVLCFDEATWAYDINVGLWYQWGWRNTLSGVLERDRGACLAFFGGTHVVGDHTDGRLYAVDMDTHTDDGDPIYRERTWAQLEAENRWITYDRGELIAEMGVGLDGVTPPPEGTVDATDGYDPKVWLQWSDDGGRTWSNAHERSLGRIGQFRHRAVWRRMGRARTRYYRIWTAAPVRMAWRGFNIDARTATK